MAIIKLPTYRGAGGKYAHIQFETLVDDEYLHFLSQFKWRLHNDHGRSELKKAYVLCDMSQNILSSMSQHPKRIKQFKSGNRPKLRLHRLVYCQHNGIDEGLADFVVDHINGNALDNRLVNLRRATTAQNNYNKRGQRKDLHGIYPYQGGYRAVIMHKGKQITSGICPTIRDAQIAYDKLATKYQGIYAVLHFPEGYAKQLEFEDFNDEAI